MRNVIFPKSKVEHDDLNFRSARTFDEQSQILCKEAIAATAALFVPGSPNEGILRNNQKSKQKLRVARESLSSLSESTL
jgi:hypothetical protein